RQQGQTRVGAAMSSYICCLLRARSLSATAAEPTLAAIRNVIGRTRAVTASVRCNHPLGSAERSVTEAARRGSLSRGRPSPPHKSIYRQWARTAHDKSGEKGAIQEVQLIARRPELRAGRGH